MPEPTYSLPVTLLGTKLRGGLFIDGVPVEYRHLLSGVNRYESADGNGETISLWPHPSTMYEPHRVTIAGITHCFWPWELTDVSPEGREHLLRRLADELAASRRRFVTDNWTADKPAHFALMKCYHVELSLLLGPTRPLPD